jgi:hypothetical protein
MSAPTDDRPPPPLPAAPRESRPTLPSTAAPIARSVNCAHFTTHSSTFCFTLHTNVPVNFLRYINACGNGWLTMNNDKAFGGRAVGIYTQSLSDWLTKHTHTHYCFHTFAINSNSRLYNSTATQHSVSLWLCVNLCVCDTTVAYFVDDTFRVEWRRVRSTHTLQAAEQRYRRCDQSIVSAR